MSVIGFGFIEKRLYASGYQILKERADIVNIRMVDNPYWNVQFEIFGETPKETERIDRNKAVLKSLERTGLKHFYIVDTVR